LQERKDIPDYMDADFADTVEVCSNYFWMV